MNVRKSLPVERRGSKKAWKGKKLVKPLPLPDNTNSLTVGNWGEVSMGIFRKIASDAPRVVSLEREEVGVVRCQLQPILVDGGVLLES